MEGISRQKTTEVRKCIERLMKDTLFMKSAAEKGRANGILGERQLPKNL
jgi:hypothetical protein